MVCTEHVMCQSRRQILSHPEVLWTRPDVGVVGSSTLPSLLNQAPKPAPSAEVEVAIQVEMQSEIIPASTCLPIRQEAKGTLLYVQSNVHRKYTPILCPVPIYIRVWPLPGRLVKEQRESQNKTSQKKKKCNSKRTCPLVQAATRSARR